MSWWSKASTAQKLAQIDGGIECGMTITQVAMASRVTRNAVSAHASYHGRKFPNKARSESAGLERRLGVQEARQSYLRGEPVDLWGNTEPQDDFLDEGEGAA